MATNPFRTLPVSPAGHVLILNAGDRVLTELSLEPCAIVAQQVLSETDIYLLLPLLQSYPSYATYSSLLAALTDEPLDRASQRVIEALEHHRLDALMKPVRQVVFRLRLKLAPFGLDIRNLGGLGYQLLIDGKQGGDNDA